MALFKARDYVVRIGTGRGPLASFDLRTFDWFNKMYGSLRGKGTLFTDFNKIADRYVKSKDVSIEYNTNGNEISNVKSIKKVPFLNEKATIQLMDILQATRKLSRTMKTWETKGAYGVKFKYSPAKLEKYDYNKIVERMDKMTDFDVYNLHRELSQFIDFKGNFKSDIDYDKFRERASSATTLAYNQNNELKEMKVNIQTARGIVETRRGGDKTPIKFSDSRIYTDALKQTISFAKDFKNNIYTSNMESLLNNEKVIIIFYGDDVIDIVDSMTDLLASDVGYDQAELIVGNIIKNIDSNYDLSAIRSDLLYWLVYYTESDIEQETKDEAYGFFNAFSEAVKNELTHSDYGIDSNSVNAIIALINNKKAEVSNGTIGYEVRKGELRL